MATQLNASRSFPLRRVRRSRPRGGLPTTDQYTAPSTFTGTIKRVVEVDGVESTDPEAEIRATFSIR